MKIARLKFEDWPLVEPFVTGEFGNAMPDNPNRATFVAAIDGDVLAGFLHVETLFHFNCVKVLPEYENQGLAVRLIEAGIQCIPAGFAGIWLADRDDKDDLRLLARNLGARDVGLYRYYRRDGNAVEAKEVRHSIRPQERRTAG